MDSAPLDRAMRPDDGGSGCYCFQVSCAKGDRGSVPGELFETRIDLLDPRWFVVWNVTNAIAPPRSVGEITNDWAARFRSEYRHS
jgi:hypothetical protein